MKIKNNIILTLAVGIICTASFNACKKKTEVDTETQSVVDNAVGEQQFMSIQPIVNEKGINQPGIRKTTACDTWSILGAVGTASPSPIDTTDANGDGVFDNGPVTFQLDFGTTGCAGFDGVRRVGKLNITTAKKWSLLNHQVTVDFIDYKANDVNISGQLKITKSDPFTFTTEVINGKCWKANWQITYASTKTVNLNRNGTPTDETDDIITLTGSSSGVSREGRAFKTNITNPLIKKSNCEFISSGTLELTPDGFKTRTVDFGNGTCDNDATFSVNGQTIKFKLQ